MTTLDVDRPVFRSPPSNKRSSFSSTSLNSLHISQAISQSPDNGATLMFSKLSLSDISVLAAEELASIGRETSEDESPVKRIALGGNRLTTLPTEFALLSSLRYLNLKHNSFSVFPEVLTLIPSLDTLDISHNKIKRLPSEAGQLVNLRVFCLSRNKITRLPLCLSQFHNLEVLQVERNPIEWPAKYLIQQGESLQPGHVMKEWVRTLQQWMEVDSREKLHDDSGYSEQHSLESHIEESYNSWRFPLRENEFEAGITPHGRSFSVDSNFSMSSIAESLQDVEASSFLHSQTDRPPPLHLGILGSFSNETSPTHSRGSYLPSPADSEYFDDSVTTGFDVTNHTAAQHHIRNASYSGLHNTVQTDLLGKKSMPDLRTAKLNFTKKVPDLPETSFTILSPIKDKTPEDFSIPSPLSQRQDSGSSLGSNGRLGLTAKDQRRLSPTSSTPSMAFERNSYFRRLSTLPITATLPKALVCLIESARSILFAMCQVYQTLEHYMVHAIDDRISSVLRKVLDPAGADMMQLINSLDRFDTMSRKMLPSPTICRGVVESCKDTVAVFGKAVGVLALQLKVILTGDDIRYSRWILLELYAATAEVSCAWQTMLPQIDSIKPLLRAKIFVAQSPLVLGAGSEGYSTSPSTTPAPDSVSLRPGVLGTPASANVGKIRTARRHAGSFSYKDVEIGKKLPSYDDVPGMFGGVVSGVATQTPTLRTPKRQTTVPITTVSSPSPASTPVVSASTSTSTSFFSESLRGNHSRQGSQASLQTSASSSPSLPSKTTFLELPSNSKSQVDKEALQAVQAAVEVAPTVWDMMEDMLGDVLNTKASVRETLETARAVTARLDDVVRAMYNADGVADTRLLREDAHLFLKTVVQLSNIIKTHGRPHAVSSTLRNNMVKLTNSTEEFAILLHVSSFSPSIPRSYTPMLSVSIAPASSLGPEENRLGSSLSRSRSAQPSGSFKLPSVSQQDGARSALPTQSFKVPTSGVRRLRSRETRIDITDPG